MSLSPREVESVGDAARIVKERGVKHIKVGVFDIDGIMRGKYMSTDKFISALDSGFGFCDVVVGWDSNDQLYDNVGYTGWHTAYPDAPVRIITDSCREMPFEENGLFFLAEFSERAASICPRNTLKRVLDKASALGYEVDCGFEYEFFVFNETAKSIREKRYRDLEPLAPGNFGYSVIRNSVDSDTYKLILDLGDAMDFGIEGLHEETGPGVLEAAIGHGLALDSADKAALFKTFSKIALQKEQKLATFMARWSNDYPGQSGHIHLSLKSAEGKPLFYDQKDPAKMSALMKHFVAGQQALMPEFLSMIAPTVNSYRRLVPGLWAPTHATVGVDNRTCAIRIISGSKNSQRLEFRIAAADANPYIVLSAVIASGLWGVENKLELLEPIVGNAYEMEHPEEQRLSQTLWDSAQKLKTSGPAKEYFGEEFVSHYAATREWEEREFRKQISNWELERYFEII